MAGLYALEGQSAPYVLPFQPLGLKALPSIENHGVGGGVRIGASGELPSQQFCRIGSELCSFGFSVLNDRNCMVCIKNQFQFLLRCHVALFLLLRPRARPFLTIS